MGTGLTSAAVGCAQAQGKSLGHGRSSHRWVRALLGFVMHQGLPWLSYKPQSRALGAPLWLWAPWQAQLHSSIPQQLPRPRLPQGLAVIAQGKLRKTPLELPSPSTARSPKGTPGMSLTAPQPARTNPCTHWSCCAEHRTLCSCCTTTKCLHRGPG